MATAPNNWTLFQEQTDEMVAKVAEALQNAANLVQVEATGELGMLAFAPDLARAPIGNVSDLNKKIGTENVANKQVVGDSSAPLLARGAYGTGSAGGYPNDGNGVPSSFFTTGDGTNFPSTFGAGFCSRRNSQQAFEIFTSTLTTGGQSAYWRKQTSNGWSSVRTFYDTSNTTLDTNGFVKAASPVFRLANSSDEAMGEGFMPDGCGAYNEKAEGVSAFRESTGVYKVTGSLGWLWDGIWQVPFEIPSDGNGNKLCFVETEEEDDGTIIVRTFSRKFDFDKVAIVAGDPMDIPDGRWIDLRINTQKWVDEQNAQIEVAEEETAA